VDSAYFLGYLLLLISGGILSLYLYMSQMKASGQFLGVSSLTLAAIGLTGNFIGVDGPAYLLIWSSFGFSLVGAFLVEYKRPKIAIPLALPFYSLALTMVLSLPRFILFGTLAFEVGVLDAWIMSTDSKRTAETERTPRSSTIPVSCNWETYHADFSETLVDGRLYLI
jgi:hypothetical protein